MIRGTLHGSNKLTCADPPPVWGQSLPETPLEGANIIVLMPKLTVHRPVMQLEWLAWRTDAPNLTGMAKASHAN